jgi:hypothetical protein
LRSKPKPTRIVEDETSPDGVRVVMDSEDWQAEREKTAESAREVCEGCERPHPLLFPNGQSHHTMGRGGGRREDRLWVPLQTIFTEPNLARWRWRRNLRWTCAEGHGRLERQATKAFRQRLAARTCACGLFRAW